MQCAWILIGYVHRDDTLDNATGGTDRDSGGVDFGHSVEDSVGSSNLSENCFAAFPFSLREINFASDGLGGSCNVKIGFESIHQVISDPIRNGFITMCVENCTSSFESPKP